MNKLDDKIYFNEEKPSDTCNNCEYHKWDFEVKKYYCWQDYNKECPLGFIKRNRRKD